MRFIKLVIISVVFFFILITLVSLFIPSTVTVSRTIDINAEKNKVMSLIHDPVRWKEWYPGADSLHPVYVMGQIRGLVLDSINKGIIVLSDSSSGDNALAFFSTKRSVGESRWTSLTQDPHNTSLNWSLKFPLRWYPWEKFSSLFFDKMYGDQLQRGLNKIKSIAEDRSSITPPALQDSL